MSDGLVCTLRAYECEPDPDGALPEAGDFFRTEAGTCYRIDDVRPGRAGSKVLFAFRCTRLGRDAVQDGDDGVWRWWWRTRRPKGAAA